MLCYVWFLWYLLLQCLRLCNQLANNSAIQGLDWGALEVTVVQLGGLLIYQTEQKNMDHLYIKE